jgi:tRNA A-37 threonylcarbamoyl transferase component Bud32
MADSSPLAHSPTLAAGAPRVPGDDEQLAAGATVGDYVVERFLGAGAMGEVYAGKHPVIGKRVAIKVLRHELAASAEAAERFIREARAVNQVDHENVVDVFAFGRLEDGRLYLVMDLVDGASLRAKLVNGPLPLEEAIKILEPIADALDAAHGKGVIHRDLKPDNIMLSSAKPPKVMILDFGIAKLVSKANEGKPTGPSTLTGAGTWLGTPSYMAPEQWSVDGAGPASDRYALGVIAFELLTGAPPFTATSVPAMMEQHFRTKVPALASRAFPEDVGRTLDRVLEKALAKDPDARYATARTFVDELRAHSVPGVAPLRAKPAAAAPRTGRAALLAAGLLGAGVLGAGIVVVLTARGREPSASARGASALRPPPTGTVSIVVRSSPGGAEVRRGAVILGTTPTKVTAQSGEHLELDVRKPGYAPVHRSVTAGPEDSAVDVALAGEQRFEGAWRMTNGEMRAFVRRGDEVDVFKLASVQGEREFFKTYRFELADLGVVFGGEDMIADSRAPNEPSCNVRVRVDYQYDPAQDRLEQRREKVGLEFADGKCIVQTRKIEPTLLARVGGPAETSEISAPVGVPQQQEPGDQKKAPPTKAPPTKQTKKVIPLDPKAAELSKLEDEKLAKESKQAPQKKRPAKPTKGKQASFDFEGSLDNEVGTLNAPNVAKKPTSTDTAPRKGSAAASQAAPQNAAPVPQSQVMPQPQPAAPQVTEPIPQAPEQQQAPIRKK